MRQASYVQHENTTKALRACQLNTYGYWLATRPEECRSRGPLIARGSLREGVDKSAADISPGDSVCRRHLLASI